jgi:hypothetical protein
MSDSDVTAMTTWDVEGFRAAVSRLDAVLDRLPGLRQRFDDVVRVVWSGDVWSGPGAMAAAGTLSRSSAVTAMGCAGLDDSLQWLRRAAAESAEAREAAVEAEGLALTVTPDELSPVSPGFEESTQVARDRLQAARDRARQHAADAAAAAERADEDVTDPGTVGELAPASWCGWLDGVPSRHQVGVPPIPTGQVPEDTAAWWSVMSPAQQLTAIARDPSTVGALAGVPAWARDRANRLVLARSMAAGNEAHRDTVTAVAQEVSDRETAGEQVQLLELDVEEGLVALGLGDLDTAESVGLLVPGVGTDVASDLDAKADDAAAVADAAEAATPGLAVATVAWMSYRTPPRIRSAANPFTKHAQDGGRALDTTLDGLAAARIAAGGQRAHTVVSAHSYGTHVAARAAEADGLMAADTLVLLGSPGMPGDAADLEVPEVFQAHGDEDWAGWVAAAADAFDLPVFGNDPSAPHFGAAALPVDEDAGHSDYYDPGSPTMVAIGELLGKGAGPDRRRGGPWEHAVTPDHWSG